MSSRKIGLFSLMLVVCTTVVGYPACHMPGAIAIPYGTSINVGPVLAGAISTTPQIGTAIVNGINVWNAAGYQTAGRIVAVGTVSSSDCPTGLPLQIGAYEFYGSSCSAAVKTGLTGSHYPLYDIPLGFSNYYENPLCLTCPGYPIRLDNKSISLNLNVVWSLNPLPGEHDVQSVVAHEVGHALGIAHGENNSCGMPSSYTPSCGLITAPSTTIDPERPTMGNYIYAGETCVRTLSAHDIQSAITPLP